MSSEQTLAAVRRRDCSLIDIDMLAIRFALHERGVAVLAPREGLLCVRQLDRLLLQEALGHLLRVRHKC